MCKCLTETAKKLIARINEGSPDMERLRPKKDAKLRDIRAENIALMLRSGTTRLNIPFIAEWDGAAGGKKIKDTRVNFIASHCPFCGEAFEKDQPDEG